MSFGGDGPVNDPGLVRRRLLAGLAAAVAAPAAARTPARHVALQALIDRYVAEKKLAGASLGLSRAGGPAQFLNAGTLAFDSAARIDADSLFRVYSMTKPVTGVAAALLIEDGRLALDQPIHELIPAFKDVRVAMDPAKSLESRPAKRPITVRHLLTHTSGLSYVISRPGPIPRAYAEKGLLAAIGVPIAAGAATLGLDIAKVGAHPTSLQAFAEALATVPLVADPGERWHYSVSLDLLGAVVERAAGLPFDAFLKRRIFDPLGMRSTAFGAVDRRRLTSNYQLSPNGAVAIDTAARGDFLAPPPYPMGGSGLVSSARDFVRFGTMLRDGGGRVMKPATARLVMSDILPPGVRFEQSGGFGFGGRVVAPGSTDGSAGTYGWGGAAGTIFWVDPVLRDVVTLMVQYMPSEAYPLRKELRAALSA
jgi:CubicO group peptidase (beta-lactamase class C family)